MSQDHSGTLTSITVTALVALIPESIIAYGEKVLSVFLLAIVAEVGRRVIAAVWKKGEK